MTKLLISGAAFALAAGITPATAQPAPPPGVAQGTAPMAVPPPPPGAPGMHGERQLHVMVMPDRTITRDEVVQHVNKLFALLDTDHDGFVTRDEVEAFHNRMMKGMERGMRAMSGMPGMMAMHRDMAKGMAEHDMPMPDRAAMFDKLDTNHDGVISRQEFMAAQPQLREQRVIIMRNGEKPGAPGEHMMMRMHGTDRGAGMGMGMHGFAMRLFEMADTNHDGRVSLQEAQAAALAQFDRADLNHDGKLTPDERRQMHQTMRMERKGS